MTGTTPNLIVYGGSFDPPHAGHVDTVRRVAERFPDAQVLIMPSAAPAVAGSTTAKQPAASFEDRLAMAALAFAPLGPHVSVANLEASLPTPNYTVRTLRTLHGQSPQAHLGLLIGGDQLASFTQWHHWQEILKLATIIAIGREGVILATPDFAPILMLEGWPPPAESRKIRASITAGEPVPDGWLAADVDHYIRKRRLYALHEDHQP